MAVPFTPPLPAAKSLLFLQPWSSRETWSGVPWAGGSWQHAVHFQRLPACFLPASCLQAHPDLPWFAGQLTCSPPASACPARCPAKEAPFWDISAASEPLSPMELGKAELLPLQHGSGWQRDVTKVRQGHSSRVEGPRLALNLMP